jgi:hypothetical protein
MTTIKQARPALTAIAAVLALSATPLSAQEAVPEADTSVSTTTAPTTEPVVSAPVDTTAAPTTDPLAPAEIDAAPAPAPVARSTPTRAATRSATPVRTAPSRVAPTAAAPAVSAVDATTPVEPVVAPTPEALAAAPMTPDVAPPVAANDTAISADTMLPLAGAAGLGIVALAGFGMAMRRRRKDDHLVQDEWHEPALVRPAAPLPSVHATRPVTATAGTITAKPVGDRPAFAWGATAPGMESASDQESRMEAAYRGPTPDNPFLSLKKRLRRAAFFDQRERAVRAGHATPVPPTAGLPKALAEQFRSAMAPRDRRVLQPA